MSLYYQDELVTLFHGDCLQVADWWEDADVMITDPPYGTDGSKTNLSGGYGRSGAHIANDRDTVTRDAALALWNGKPAAVFGSPRLADPPMVVADRLVWDKTRLGINGGPWRYRHESIYVSPGFARVSDAASSIMAFLPNRLEQATHIHAKPVRLMMALVGAAPDGVIADPFAGGGPTLVAAKQLGRQCIAVEYEEAHCETIAKRLSLEPVRAPGQEFLEFEVGL